GQDDLTGPQLLDALRPGHRLQPGRLPAAPDVDLPDFLAALDHPPGVDVHDRGTAAELARDPRHEVGVAHRGGVDADLLGPGLDEPGSVIKAADAAADRERHEQLL